MTLHLSRRSLRLSSGVVLFVYIAAHFFNHALGLVSMAFAEQGLRVTVAFWHSLPGTILLYGAASIHITLAFLAIYQHRTLRLPWLEWVRIGAGLSIPTLLIGHAVDTRLAFEVNGRPTDYAHIVWSLWNSGREGRQIALLVPGWLHGCLGLKFALSNRKWYPHMRLPLFGAALLLPVLAVLGFFSMLKEVTVLAHDPSWIAATIEPVSKLQQHPLGGVRNGLLIAYYCAIAAVFIARAIRAVIEKRNGRLVSIAYPTRTVKVPRGWTVLDASRAHYLAHTSMCGGRARCSTCRVRVVSGTEHCLPPTEEERHTLQRIHAPDGTRLACQLRPQGDIGVIPLVTHSARVQKDVAYGSMEHNLCVALIAVRWGEPQRPMLPHDLLHVANRFGEEAGKTMRAAGGVPIQFTGDRVMVLFGLDVSPLEANRRAFRAAAELDARLLELGLNLQRELGCVMKHVICLHHGATIVGETGDQHVRMLTAIGGAVDVVRQLIDRESFQTASIAAQTSKRIVVSRAVFDAAQRDSPLQRWTKLELADGKCVEFGRIDSANSAELAAKT
jgi:adenylate cyclase